MTGVQTCALPIWHDAALERAAPAFDNPDFVDVVAHSYAHRIGAALGQTRYLEMEQQLSAAPEIAVPTIVIRGGSGGLGAPASPKFTRLIDQRIAQAAGHNPAQEAPEIVISAIVDLVRTTAPAS